MSRRTFVGALTVAISVALVAAAAGDANRKVKKAPDPTSLKLAFVTNNAAQFWKIAEAGIKKYNQEAGINCEIKLPSNGKTEEQNEILENLVAQGYDGIAVSCIAPNDQVDEINKAARATNVICHDSDCPKSNRLFYIGTNNYEAGKVLGGEIVRLLPKGGKVAVFCGFFSADNAAERLRGIKDAIASHGIEIVKQVEDQTDRNKARTNVEDVINSTPDLSLACGLWSYNGPAIAKALEGSGRKGRILAAAFDEETDTLTGIEDGTIACTVVQKPFQFGYLAAKLLHEMAIKGKAALPAVEYIDTGVSVIRKENVKQFEEEMAKLKG